MKCQNNSINKKWKCNATFPEEQKAYIKGKIVCQRCFNRLKTGKGNGETSSIQKAYMEFISI